MHPNVATIIMLFCIYLHVYCMNEKTSDMLYSPSPWLNCLYAPFGEQNESGNPFSS